MTNFAKRLFGRPHSVSRTNQETTPLGDYILGFCSGSQDARSYAETHLARLIRTLELTPKGQPGDAILEMGAYMQITPALHTVLGYSEVRGCYLGQLGSTDNKSVVSASGEQFCCEIDLFNAEADRYPYADGRFAAVLCCELLEHLAEDPMHMMSEVNRILRPGGHFVLSTPNIAALRSIAAVFNGYHPGLFSQYTARVGGNRSDPRHSREYTPREIRQLFEAAGFRVTNAETGPYGLPSGSKDQREFDWVLPLLQEKGFSTEMRDDVIHIVGSKAGPVRDRYPAWLYV